MTENYSNGWKTLWEKEKLLVTSNFSFSHSVFKRLVSQGRQKVSLCGNGLIAQSMYKRISVKSVLKNLMGKKGGNAGNQALSFFPQCYQHFLLFPQCFYPLNLYGQVLSKIYFFVCIRFQFGQAFNFVVWSRGNSFNTIPTVYDPETEAFGKH